MRINLGHAAKQVQEIQQNATEKTENAERADGQREKKTEKAEKRKGWLCQGWLWVDVELSSLSPQSAVRAK